MVKLDESTPKVQQPSAHSAEGSALSDAQKDKILHYGEVDAGYRHEQVVVGNKYGYGSATFLDYLIPDKDPNLKYMQQEPEEHTLFRYVHNRKKVFTWQQVSYAFGAVATLFGGLAVTNQAGAFFAGIGLGSITGAAAITTVLGVAAACALGAFVAGYYAFRSDLKNDVDIEEMQAKRVGYHVGKNLEKVLTVDGKSVAQEVAEIEKVAEIETRMGNQKPTSAQEVMAGPLKHISHAQSHERVQAAVEQALAQS